MTPALSVTRSILGQPWRWRGLETDRRDAGFEPDDLVTQLLLARGVPREAIEQHRTPTIRGFMPDPSIFRDMEVAAERLAAAVLAGEPVTIFGDGSQGEPIAMDWAGWAGTIPHEIYCGIGSRVPRRYEEGNR